MSLFRLAHVASITVQPLLVWLFVCFVHWEWVWFAEMTRDGRGIYLIASAFLAAVVGSFPGWWWKL